MDRGARSCEVFQLLMSLKLVYPDRITLLRGNHECSQITLVYGFYNECVFKYGNTDPWKWSTDVFNCLGIAAVSWPSRSGYGECHEEGRGIPCRPDSTANGAHHPPSPPPARLPPADRQQGALRARRSVARRPNHRLRTSPTVAARTTVGDLHSHRHTHTRTPLIVSPSRHRRCARWSGCRSCRTREL